MTESAPRSPVSCAPSCIRDAFERAGLATLAKRLIVVALFASSSPQAGTSTVAAQELPTFETTEVAEGVYRFRWQAHVGMFVVGADGVAAFDPINPEAAAAYAGEIRRVAPGVPLRWIVYSHSDADHASGGDVLAEAFGGGVPIAAHHAAVDEIAERASPDQPPPTVTFERSLRLDLGGRDVELHYFGPSHTDNLLIGYVPHARVAFAVDFVGNDRVGYQALPGWRFPEQNETILGMMGLPFETVIFGHGDVGDRETMWRQARYWDALERAARDAVDRGLGEDEAAASIRLPEFAGFESYDAWFELNVRGAYRAIAGG